MTLKSIEMSGFKSFAKKHSFSFGSNVTAVVGPNGSGKSNVVEAFRFVLGEQSIKSLRSKSGADLIFKGSKQLPALSRAGVAIAFDNKNKKFSFSGDNDRNISLDYDEVVIGREVYRDGVNKYTINGTEVRLKDILDLVASVNIGSSGHHIISQGEADRILSANQKDRRGMIEDALGLKIFQYKIKESERKLEKTRLNMKEVGSLRRELAPHLGFLKKQVEKINKAQEMRNELKSLYLDYFSHEARSVRELEENTKRDSNHYNHELEVLNKKIEKLEENRGQKIIHPEEENLKRLEEEIHIITKSKDDISRAIGRLEGMIDMLSEKPSLNKEESYIKNSIILEHTKSIENLLFEIENAQDMDIVRSVLSRVRMVLEKMCDHKEISNEVPNNENIIMEHIANKNSLQKELDKILDNEKEIHFQINKINNEIKLREEKLRNGEREYFEFINQRNELINKERMQLLEREIQNKRKNDFEEERREAVILIGSDVIRYSECTGILRSKDEQEIIRRQIERLKIKLEDAGGAGGSDILKEFKETSDRDTFLSRELVDLEQGILNLTKLIADLRESLDKNFKTGIEKINLAFQEFFALMFGGGSGFLSIVVEHKRPSKNDDEEEKVLSDIDEQEFRFEQGVEINVSLPHKKVKDLHMLSGGERSLTSIALLFAMSQVNPPPFLVLDETDAALDEANSRRYGDMIERLSKNTQLIVVTHNRETMSRANVLYGVTVGSDGSSRLLSVKFDEAMQYAK